MLYKIPILVISCDKYSDLWEPFFKIFWKMWPDCPYPVYLGSNYKAYQGTRVTTIKIGEDISWSTGVLRMLEHLNSEYVILFLEDFFIKQLVNTGNIERLVQIAVEKRTGCLRLAAGLPLALPPTSAIPEYPGLGIIAEGEPYRVSLQIAIWQVETLRKLLIPGFNAWEFEEIGSKLSVGLSEKFWGTYEPAIKYGQVVEKGKWKPEGLKICSEAGVAVDLTLRHAFSNEELEEYFRLYLEKNTYSQVIQKQITRFIDGQTAEAVDGIMRCIRRRPFDLKLWLIFTIGLTAPFIFSYYRNYKVKHKLKSSGRLVNAKGEAV